MGNNIPVFSIMTAGELSAWAWKYGRGKRKLAEEILPGKPKGYVSIVSNIAQLARALAKAKDLKERNLLKEAAQQEEIAQNIKDALPYFAKPS